MRSFTLSAIANETLQKGKFLVAAFLGSQANASRASHVWRSRKRKRKSATRGEKDEDIWSREEIKVSEGWHVKE